MSGDRLRIALWSPLPPSPSGIADYVAEQLPLLGRRFELRTVDRETPPETVVADLDLYQLGNSPAHAFVYRAALRRPGVVVLHEWSLHHLVLRETVERGDVAAYLREMRRSHGEAGSFVGRQVARALGGDLLPALYPLNDRVLEGCLAVVALTEFVRSRAARRLPGRPVLHLPHHLALPFDPPPTREAARRRLGLPHDALLVTAPGLATAAKGLAQAMRAVAALRGAYPKLQLVVAGEADPKLDLAGLARDAGPGALHITGRLDLTAFALHLCAADVVLALRFPSHGEISGALLRALGVGRPALVTAGTPSAEEFPEGIVIPVDPGAAGEAELRAVLDHLLASPELRERIGRLARAYVRQRHELGATTTALADFMERVFAQKAALAARLAADRAVEGSLLGYLMEEVRWGARDLGLPGAALDLESLLAPLARGGA